MDDTVKKVNETNEQDSFDFGVFETLPVEETIPVEVYAMSPSYACGPT